MAEETQVPVGRRSAFSPEDFGSLPTRVRSRLAERLSSRDPSVLLVSGAHTLNAVPFNVQMARTPVQPQSEPVFKCGWATKRGRMVRSWKRRWFVLSGDTLDYYEDDRGGKLKGSVCMDNARAKICEGGSMGEGFIELTVGSNSYGGASSSSSLGSGGGSGGSGPRAVSSTGSGANGSSGSVGGGGGGGGGGGSGSGSGSRTLIFNAQTEEENKRWVAALRLKAACLLYRRKVTLLRGEIDWRIVRCFGDAEASTLTLEDVTLSLEGVVAVVHLLQYHPSLSCLRMRNAGVGDVAIDAIAEAIKESSRVSSLHLDQNHLTKEGVHSIVQVLLSTAPVSTVNLAENIFGDAGCESISRGIQNAHVALQSLNLSECGITDLGAEHLARAIASVDASSPSKRCYLRVSTLSLAGNQIGARGAMAIADACRANHSVINVEMHKNSVPSSEIENVRAAFLRGTAVRRIELEHNAGDGEEDDMDDDDDDDDDDEDDNDNNNDKDKGGENGEQDTEKKDATGAAGKSDVETRERRTSAIKEHVRRIRSETIDRDAPPPSLLAPAKMARRMSRANMSLQRQGVKDDLRRRAAIQSMEHGGGNLSEEEDEAASPAGAAAAGGGGDGEPSDSVGDEPSPVDFGRGDGDADAADADADAAAGGGDKKKKPKMRSRISAFFGRGRKSNASDVDGPMSPAAPEPVSHTESGSSNPNGDGNSGDASGDAAAAAAAAEKNDQDLRSSFAFVLHDSTAFSYFKVFLMREYSEENAYFWEAVERFRSGLLEGHASQRELAEHIHERYVKHGSEFDVNIISASKTKCGDMLDGRVPLPDGKLEAVFDECQAGVRELMERDSYPRFLKSSLWEHYTEGTERRITGEKSHTGHATRHRTETVDGQVASELGMLQRSYLRRAAANSASSLAHLRQSVHDHLDLGVSDMISREISKYGREIVRYSDYADKINPRGKTQTRVMLVTDAAWYNLVPKTLEVKRRVPLREIVSLTYNMLPDDDHVYAELETGNDYLIASRRKMELLAVLAQEYRMVVDAPLQLKEIKGEALRAFTDEIDGQVIAKNDINLIWRLLVTPKGKGAKDKRERK